MPHSEVISYDDRVTMQWSFSDASSADSVVHVAGMVDGEARWGGGEYLEGDNPAQVVVYLRTALDRTSIPERLAFGIEPGETLAIVVEWSPRLMVGQEITFTPENGFETKDLGSPDEVLAYFIGSGMAGGGALSDAGISKSLAFTRLTVDGYRGFGSRATLQLAIPTGVAGSGLTVLVGANNSGKSTFLEALHLLARARHTMELSIPQPQRHKATDRVELDIERADGQILSVKTVRDGSAQARGEWKPANAGPTQFAIHLTPARRVFNPYSGNMGSGDRDWNLSDGNFSRTQSRDSFVGRLRKVDRDPAARQLFDALLTEIVGVTLNWTFDEMAPGQQFVKLIEPDGAWHTSEGLGEGLISLLFIVDALYDSAPGSLIAIDEPELSLHPQLIRRLRRVLSRYAADRQVVIATHSPLLIDWEDVAAGAAIARTHKVRNISRLSQVSRDTMAAVAGLATSGNTFNPHALGSEAREAFFLEDGILLVEGQEDVVYLRTVLDDLGLPQFENVYGWGVGGVTNMPLLAKLFLELGFTRVAALVDGDDNPGTVKSLEALEAMGGPVLVRRIPADDIRTKPKQSQRSERPGLLDATNEHVRSELAATARAVMSELHEHLAPGRSVTDASPRA